MAQDKPGFELIKLMDLPEGTPLDERLWRWTLAFDAWLAERRSSYGRKTWLTAYRSWRDFLALTGKAPWEVGEGDVRAYIESLEAKGLRPGSINERLTALESFYAYCRESGDAICGAGFSPLSGVRRPKRVEYENARYLSEKEEAALLDAIRRDDAPIGKRDYALILMLLRTGWKAGVVRELRWGDLETWRRGDLETGRAASLIGDRERVSKAPVVSVKGELLPGEVGEAILDYLAAAGRLEGIGDAEYVFAPVSHRWVSERFDGAEDWDGGRPLSQKWLSRIVKQHAQAAGLRAGAITCHTLRHTSAMRRLEQGHSLEAVGAYLGRTEKRANRAYLRQLQRSPKGRLKARRRGQPNQLQVRSRKPHRYQRGDRTSLTHGLWARRLPEFAWLAEQGIRLHPADAAVLRWRIVIMRAMILWEHIETVQEASQVLKVVAQATANLARAVKDRGKLRDLARELRLEEDLPDG